MEKDPTGKVENTPTGKVATPLSCLGIGTARTLTAEEMRAQQVILLLVSAWSDRIKVQLEP